MEKLPVKRPASIADAIQEINKKFADSSSEIAHGIVKGSEIGEAVKPYVDAFAETNFGPDHHFNFDKATMDLLEENDKLIIKLGGMSLITDAEDKGLVVMLHTPVSESLLGGSGIIASPDAIVLFNDGKAANPTQTGFGYHIAQDPESGSMQVGRLGTDELAEIITELHHSSQKLIPQL